jgi:hypothetical protein
MSTQLHPDRTTQQSRPTRDKKSNLLQRLTPRRSSNQASPMTSTSFPSFRSSTGSRSRHTRRSNAAASSPTSQNLMQWLQTECPQDLLPRILAFAGPQTASAFARTNKFWNEVAQKESTWRTICEELYKVRHCFSFRRFF